MNTSSPQSELKRRLAGRLAAACMALLAFSTTPSHAQAWRWYNENPSFTPATLPNGTVINFNEWKKALPYVRIDGKPPRAEPVADKVWMVYGYFYGPVIIERPNGLLVFSTGENEEDGKKFREIIRRDVSTKPIIAIFYDHAHYAKGAKSLLDGDSAMIVAHPDSNKTVQESGFLGKPNIPEMLPALNGRARIHFGTDMPDKGPDAKMGAASLDLGKKSAWMPATLTLGDGESITVDGLEIQAFHAITDTEDTLTFWIPSQKLVIDNVMWPCLPNLYTLRGDRYREPEQWTSAIKKIRDLEPEIELDVGGGAKALKGREAIKKTANALIDASSFVYDQAIRLTNQGVRMQELRHHIVLPASLLKNPYVNEVYGQYDTFPQAYADHSHGWFSGHAEDLHALPRSVESKKWVELSGGEAKVYEAYRVAVGKGEHLWAKDLAVVLTDVAPANRTYRQALADSFRTLGRYSPGSITRNFYLASARSLEGETTHTLGSVQEAEWVVADTSRAVNHLRTRLNPEEASGKEGELAFDIGGTRSALHIRNSVAEFVAEPDKHYRKPDATIKASPEMFARYFRGELSLAAFVKESGANAQAAALLGLFDEFHQVPMYPVAASGLDPSAH
ncbi:alkyl sulfatase dimerization domain-containing protein [Variovorax sp. J22R24]|uniref:alkyl sulfatase dimerization domain-containing protein n=1 Tax=Variovorax gracilis TaxID=3053502 RepID=UPI002575534D|nr:alkyl sulfatase dimerization domain-containing protein [Variovorax sp. J22R24]MDM0108587.1 alkyl sulfatase dimerization domain-containing protein [Variovorax sp. J22R24]